VSWFKCDGCGACCRAVDCHFLVGDKCSIYHERPLICRVDKQAELMKNAYGMSYEDYFKMTKENCDKLKKDYPPKKDDSLSGCLDSIFNIEPSGLATLWSVNYKDLYRFLKKLVVAIDAKKEEG
jgi:hypothetical protein